MPRNDGRGSVSLPGSLCDRVDKIWESKRFSGLNSRAKIVKAALEDFLPDYEKMLEKLENGPRL